LLIGDEADIQPPPDERERLHLRRNGCRRLKSFGELAEA
jgi:hypothetical protein